MSGSKMRSDEGAREAQTKIISIHTVLHICFSVGIKVNNKRLKEKQYFLIPEKALQKFLDPDDRLRWSKGFSRGESHYYKLCHHINPKSVCNSWPVQCIEEHKTLFTILRNKQLKLVLSYFTVINVKCFLLSYKRKAD